MSTLFLHCQDVSDSCCIQIPNAAHQLSPQRFFGERKTSTIVLSSSPLNRSPAQHTSPICSTRPGRSFSPAPTAVCCWSWDEDRDRDSVLLDFDCCGSSMFICRPTQSSAGHVVALHLDFDLFERPRPKERIRRSFDDAVLWTALPRKRLIELGAAVFAVSASRYSHAS